MQQFILHRHVSIIMPILEKGIFYNDAGVMGRVGTWTSLTVILQSK